MDGSAMVCVVTAGPGSVHADTAVPSLLAPCAAIRASSTYVAMFFLCILALALVPCQMAAQSFTDITAQVTIASSGLVFDPATDTVNSQVTITNSSSATINASLVLLVSNITPSAITLANASGQTPSGTPYVSLPVQAGGLIPGGTISNVLLEFNDPSRRLHKDQDLRARFSFSLSVAEILTSQAAPIFGPQQYPGTAGSPQPVTVTFLNCEPSATYQLFVANGNSNGTNRVNSATILLNGTQVVGPSDLSQGVASVTKTITVTSSNALVTTVGPPAGSFISVSVQCVSNCLSVQISSPASGSSLSLSSTNVGGTVTSSADEVGITVNGLTALTQGGQFQAPNVPLSLGMNSLTATATNACGNQATSTIQVTATAVNPPAVSITATPASGVAPDAVTFTATVSSSNPIAQYQWDFGNGSTGASGATLSQVSNTYANPGLYMANLTVTDTMGNRLSAQIPILVMSAAALNSLIQSRWSAFTAALANNHPNSALTFMLPAASAEFQKIFNELGTGLPSIAASLGNVALSSASGGVAEFITIRQQNGENFVYFIEFMQDQNGLWKIESM